MIRKNIFMVNYFYKKYLILAVVGALIIGVASYLFLNIYFNKEEILVAVRDIEKGEKIKEDDIDLKEFYKNSLPEDYLQSKEEVVGSIIQMDRKKGDFISKELFTKDLGKNIIDDLSKGEVLIAINMQYLEPLVEELKTGGSVSIISTQIDKELLNSSKYVSGSYTNGSNYLQDDSNNSSSSKSFIEEDSYYNCIESLEEGNCYIKNDFMDNNSYKLSEKILLINGQLIVRNLEIVNIKEYIISKSSSLISGGEEQIVIYVKCSIKEAPIVARLTKDDKYKIVIEKI